MKEFKGNAAFIMMGTLFSVMAGMVEFPILYVITNRVDTNSVLHETILSILPIAIYIVSIIAMFSVLTLFFPTKIIVGRGKIIFCSFLNRTGVEVKLEEISQVRKSKGYGKVFFAVSYDHKGRSGYKMMDDIYYDDSIEFEEYFDDLYKSRLGK